MKCQKIRRLIPDFLEGQLSDKLNILVSGHLKLCRECVKEKELYEKFWQLAGSLEDIEPEPAFKSRFWTRLAREQVESERSPDLGILGLLLRHRLALATAVAVMIAISVVLPNYLQQRSIELLASKISEEEVVLVENIDLLENLNVISDIDFLVNMEFIESLGRIDLGTA